MRIVFVALGLALAGWLTSCGGDGQGSALPTSPPPPQPTRTAFSLEGRVSDRETGASLAGARILIESGSHTGSETTTGEDGRYRFDELAGALSLSVTLDRYEEQRATVTMDRDRTLDFPLVRIPGFVLEGHVTDRDTGAGLDAARVVILDGDHAGREALTDNFGTYRIQDVKGAMNLSATADGYGERRVAVEVTADQTLDFGLFPLPTPQPFAAGRRLVNDEIVPGRYFSNPSPGCFWERLGADGAVIASEYLGFDAEQEIVDISESDHIFHGDDDCGRWREIPTASPASGTGAGAIPPGRWLVGSQIPSGEYAAANARAGCYWARLRRFSGETRLDVIENGFTEDDAPERVTILPTDIGFFTDAECGPWTRIGLATGSTPAAMAESEIIQNHQHYRSLHPLR